MTLPRNILPFPDLVTREEEGGRRDRGPIRKKERRKRNVYIRGKISREGEEIFFFLVVEELRVCRAASKEASVHLYGREIF